MRSTVAHGVLEAIELDPSFDWSQVTVATAADIPGKNVIALIEDDQPALVAIGAPVMHVDEAIALVAAPTKELAMAAARAVKPRIRPLPAVFTVEDSLAAKHKLYGDDNVFKQFMIRKGHASDADFEAVMARAAHVIEGTYYTSPQEQMYIEPQAMMARVERRPLPHRRLDAVPVLRAQGDEAAARLRARRRRDHAVGDRRRVRRQGGVPVDARGARRRCWRGRRAAR